MKKIILTIMLLLSMSVQAGMSTDSVSQAGWSNLSEAQKAEVLKAVTEKAAQTQAIPNQLADPAKLNEWVQLGSNIGLAFGGAAKELGIQVNEFVKTPVGYITMVLVVVHFMGGLVLHVFGAILILIVGFGFLRWHSYTQRTVDCIYDETKTNIFGNHPILKKSKSIVGEDWAAWHFAIGIVLIIASGIILFTV